MPATPEESHMTEKARTVFTAEQARHYLAERGFHRCRTSWYSDIREGRVSVLRLGGRFFIARATVDHLLACGGPRGVGATSAN